MTRKQTMKVYHGIPKSITDEHTLFYESCDGKLDNSYTVIHPISFYPNVTGYGVYETTTDEFSFALTTECKIQTKVFTIDFWATMKTPVNNSYAGRLFEITFNNNSNYKIRLERDSSSNKFHLWENGNLIYGEFDFSSANINKPHHFRIIFKVGDYCKMYIDGKEPNIVLYQNKLTTTFEYISHIRLSGSNFSISDFHLSNIDRGDYFPNLPQDFIDGKAVIKPRMGQQQIKGDPMYSQVTNLKVEAFTGVEYPTLVDNNYYMHRHNPELSVKGANHWNAGSSFRIKGLNGEVISGVIDTDTALCRIEKCVSNYSFIVNDVSKLVEGDLFKIMTTHFNDYDIHVRTITNIDPLTKTITFSGPEVNGNAVANGWNILVEVTASSSSPTVKTLDGTNVVGTWSGLGTNEATFTLGANTSITGQDLYVTYALTIPYGNSDFPELPYSIEKAWGENGVEMKPVSQIIITDDFKGKILGDNAHCPHFMGWNFGNTLQPPSTFSENDKQDHYIYVSSQDNITRRCITSNLGHIPQQLFRFNLLECVERKLGAEIPSRNKVQWLKDNISYLGLRWYGNGYSYLGNKAQCEVYLVDSKTYTSTGKSNTTSSPSLCQLDVSSNTVGRVIDDTGYVSFVVFAMASDGNSTSSISTDYVALDLILKHDSRYTPLYCDNQRAREDVCNPVLVQKETKTVKRYLPSKEIFSTECLYAKFKNEGVVSGLDILANKHVNIGVTTSEYNKFVSGSKINLNQLPLEKSEHLYTPILDSKIMDSIPNHVGANITELPVIHWWSDNGNKLFTVATTETLNFKTCVNGTNALKGQIGGYKDVNNNIIIYGDVDKSNILTKDGLRLYDISLVNKDGELMLYVIKSSEGNRFYFYNDAITLIKVPNRPLIK